MILSKTVQTKPKKTLTKRIKYKDLKNTEHPYILRSPHIPHFLISCNYHTLLTMVTLDPFTLYPFT